MGIFNKSPLWLFKMIILLRILKTQTTMSCLFAGMWLQGAWTRSAGSWHFCRISICLFAKALKQVISQIFKLGKHIFSPTVYLFAIVFVPVFTKCLSQREKRRERPCSPAFVLSTCVNAGRRESHWKCTMWTSRFRQPQPLHLTHTNTHRIHITRLCPFSPQFLHIKNAVLLSVAVHTAEPVRLAGRYTSPGGRHIPASMRDWRASRNYSALHSNVYTFHTLSALIQNLEWNCIYKKKSPKNNKKTKTLDHVMLRFPGFSAVQQADVQTG